MSQYPAHQNESSLPTQPDPSVVPTLAAAVARASLSVHTLPEGTRLREYEVVGLVGEGGFGIVYLAYDHTLQREVAVKEYMPASIATRAHGSAQVVVKAERHADTFRVGLKSFVNEARMLARFDNPSLVKVYRFWEQNNTAYMAMPYYEGATLKHALAELGRPPSEAELRAWLRPLLDALMTMHAARCYHRDIAPDNILLTPSGPLLLDFGAARRVIGDMTQALTVMLKPGYAPIEQYGEVESMSQGAWTDLYALASVMHFAVTGKPPMSSVERLMEDQYVPLGTREAGRYSAPFLQAIDAALAVKPQNRPQSVAEFRDLLDGRGSASVQATEFVATRPAEFTTTGTIVKPRRMPTPVETAPAPVMPLASEAQASAPALAESAIAVESDVTTETGTAPGRSRVGVLAVSAGVLAVLAGTGAYLAWQIPAPHAVSATAPAPARILAPPAARTPAALPPVAAAPVPAPASQTRMTSNIASTDRVPRAARPSAVRASAPVAETSVQCSDMLQKASLEALTPSETAFLRKECR
ncbi:MAG: serine/threonine protein kinase [Proteobacteria bacterium]|nr:serine/threonine protein kinase [Pseudomonadota bacterium]